MAWLLSKNFRPPVTYDRSRVCGKGGLMRLVGCLVLLVVAALLVWWGSRELRRAGTSRSGSVDERLHAHPHGMVV